MAASRVHIQKQKVFAVMKNRLCDWSQGVAVLLVNAVGMAGMASAQGSSAAIQPAEKLVAPFPCPASGVAPLHYGVTIGNSANLVPFEFASPCIPKEVLRAAEALGMARLKPVTVKGVSSMDFTAAGPVAAEGKGASTIQAAAARFSVAYYVPGLRMNIAGTREGKEVNEIRVVAGGRVWNEQQPGIGELPATGSAAEREALIYLTPFGAVWALVEAEGAAKVRAARGRTVIEAPLDLGSIAVTLDKANFPVEVKLKSSHGTYEARFSGYRQGWEPHYLVQFPEHIVWHRDGAVIADLTVKKFNSNTYVVFPKPIPADAATAGDT
jgi:hypothetical protein